MKQIYSPENIVLIGGGRWSRVILQSLYNLTPSSVNIYIYSARNATNMNIWVSENNFDSRIKVSSFLPQNLNAKSTAVIVVNAVQDHEKAVEWALNSGFPVIVEKPIAYNYNTAKRLVDLAHAKKTLLTTAHIFLFADYFETFASKVNTIGETSSIDIQWTDPVNEKRHGECKKYDSSLTIFADWLPHISSMIGRLVPNKPQIIDELELKKGGADVCISLKVGKIPCKIQMIRNAHDRKRIVELGIGTNRVKLDFTEEPVTFFLNQKIDQIKSHNIKEQRPSELLLEAFLNAAAGKEIDQRLNAEIGLRASELIEKINKIYKPKQIQWLCNKLSKKIILDEDLRYALTELLQASKPMPDKDIEIQINNLIKLFSGPLGNAYIKKMERANNSDMLEELLSI